MLNKITLIGNLGQDVEVRTTPGGQMVATMSVATTERWTDKQGQRQEETEWHRVVLWGKLAELAERYLRKGSRVYVEGRVKSREYTDKEGASRRSFEVVAREMKFLGGDRAEGGAQTPTPARTSYAPPPAQAAAGDGWTDDIPF